MLTIHNTTYMGINNPNLRRALGIHVNWTGTFFNYHHYGAVNEYKWIYAVGYR